MIKSKDIHPETIRIGDHIADYGFVMQVTAIKVVVHNQADVAHYSAIDGIEVIDRTLGGLLSDLDDMPCFCIFGTYADGDTEMFNYFRHIPSSGPDCGKATEFAYLQGNELRHWHKAI